MDNIIPAEIAQALEMDRRARKRSQSRYVVIAGNRCHRVTEISKDGFVIEADGRPPLRGYVDLVDGDEDAVLCLVSCIWVRDGLVGYEFKHVGTRNAGPIDYSFYKQ